MVLKLAEARETATCSGEEAGGVDVEVSQNELKLAAAKCSGEGKQNEVKLAVATCSGEGAGDIVTSISHYC
jgi:hypothetical protein